MIDDRIPRRKMENTPGKAQTSSVVTKLAYPSATFSIFEIRETRCSGGPTGIRDQRFRAVEVWQTTGILACRLQPHPPLHSC